MSNSISYDVTWLKELPIDKINGFEDEVVFRIARMTLDFTIPHIPYLTGRLQRASLAYGVQGSNRTYSLGATGEAGYAKAVYFYPQETTHWTNPRSYSQWFLTEYKNQREVITGNAVTASYKNWK